MHSVVPSKTIPDSRPKWAKSVPAFRPKRRKKPPAKTLPDRAAHTYMACIREYPPGPQLFSPWGPSRKKNDGYARRLSSGSRRPTYSSTLYDMRTVHSPLFFRKIVEIERFAFRAAILRECQNYLGGRGRFGRKRENFSRPPPPRAIIPDARPLGTFENQDDALYLNDLTKK